MLCSRSGQAVAAGKAPLSAAATSVVVSQHVVYEEIGSRGAALSGDEP